MFLSNTQLYKQTEMRIGVGDFFFPFDIVLHPHLIPDSPPFFCFHLQNISAAPYRDFRLQSQGDHSALHAFSSQSNTLQSLFSHLFVYSLNWTLEVQWLLLYMSIKWSLQNSHWNKKQLRWKYSFEFLSMIMSQNPCEATGRMDILQLITLLLLFLQLIICVPVLKKTSASLSLWLTTRLARLTRSAEVKSG